MKFMKFKTPYGNVRIRLSTINNIKTSDIGKQGSFDIIINENPIRYLSRDNRDEEFDKLIKMIEEDEL